ncbi:hypothetical protein HanIR_Chr16g0840171 [Helianthus annuus]|nr:hypothetical protein HanIR_Chr16g0840171 [Helianthus annuus]
MVYRRMAKHWCNIVGVGGGGGGPPELFAQSWRICSFRIEIFGYIRFRPPVLYKFLGIYVFDPPVRNLKLRHCG